MNTKRGMFQWSVGALVLAMALASAASVEAQPDTSIRRGKLDEVVRQAVEAGRPARTIIRFRTAAARQRAARLIARRGGSVRRTLSSVQALSADLDAATVDALAADAQTLTVSIDAPVRSSALPTAAHQYTADSAARWDRLALSLPVRRSGVSIAIIDSGVQPQRDLPASRIRKFIDFVHGRPEPYDDFGHGTHVAGIAAASTPAVSGVGNADGTNQPDIVALKVLDAQGAGSTSHVIAALEWVAANHLTYNIRVVNLSLGHPVYEPAATDPLVQAAEALVRRGVVVVASAGNLGLDPRDQQPGFGGISSPANAPSVIAVGAVDDHRTLTRIDDSVTPYSSRGPTRFDLRAKPDLVASGHRVVSLAAPGSYLFDRFPALLVTSTADAPVYMTLSGTSMAAPSVARTAAAMVATNPDLSAGAVRALLEFTAEHLPDSTLLAQGAGYLNTAGALRLASAVRPSSPLGSLWLNDLDLPTTPFDIVSGDTILWAKNIVWGEGVLLGDSAYLHLAAWNDHLVWGEDLQTALRNIVWGECGADGCRNIVWGEHADASGLGRPFENIVWGECASAACDTIVPRSEAGANNIVWGECFGGECGNVERQNIVWGESGHVLGYWADSTVWGFWADGTDWTAVARGDRDDTGGDDTSSRGNNIVWGEAYLENIVWGECAGGECRNIVWGEHLTILTRP